MSQFPILKVRKKPAVEDAILFDGTAECATRIIDWVLTSPSGGAHWRCDIEKLDSENRCIPNETPHALRIQTLYGWTTVPEGWTVVMQDNGRFVAVQPDVFQGHYDIVEGAE